MWNQQYIRRTIIVLIILSTGINTITGIEQRDKQDGDPHSLIFKSVLGALYSNPDSAGMILDQSKDFFEATGNISLKASYYHHKGLICHVKSNATEALSFYQESYKLYDEIGDSVKTNVMLINISSCYIILGQYAKAKTILNERLGFFERIKDSVNLTNIYLNLSFVHIEAMEHGVAESYLRKAAIYAKDPVKAGRILNNLGEVLIEENRNNDALATFFDALRISKEANDNLTVSMILNNIGCLYMNISETDSAYYYFRKVLAFNRGYVEDRLILVTYKYMALLEWENGNYKDMMNYFNKSLEIAKENNYIKERADIYSLLSEWYSKQKDFEKAFYYKNISTIINDSLFNETKSRQIKEIEAIYQNEKKQQEIKTLSEQNTINMLKLRTNRVLIVSLSLFVTLIMTVSILLIRQHKLKTREESLLLERRLLRSQMNPHFIFNALSAIQNQVLQKPAIEAASYISGFAKLMRSILISSRNEVIALDTEIETITEYLSLQKLRLSDKLQYNFSIDMPFDTSEVVVPPMLLQPFIENSVEHGIAKKIVAEGNIWITFKAYGQRLLISIEDDGVGLENNGQENIDTRHKSLASKITHERMVALKKSFKKNFSYSITNRVNNDGKITGAIVSLDIPLLFNDK